jgi:hypothetical protein
VVAVHNPLEISNGSRLANVIRYESKNMMQVAMIMKKVNEQYFNLNTYHNDIAPISEVFRATSIYCDDLLADTEFLDFLRSRNYTVGMAQFFEGCAFGLFELLGIRSTHQLMAIPIEEQSAYLHGLPQLPSYVRGKLIWLDYLIS